MPSTEAALAWLHRWDRQQEHYLPDREERFTVIGDVVETVAGPSATVVDLGAGPGSLAVRLLDRLPEATVRAVDADRLLLGLARAAYGDRAGLGIVEHDLRDPAWVEALGLEGPVDAVVSTTALHWLTADELRDVYAGCARLLRTGGVLVNGDHIADVPTRPRLDSLLSAVRDARRARTGAGSEEDWGAWWAAVAQAPELADLHAERAPRPLDHDVPEPPGFDDHVGLLHEAGFAEAGTVWQCGDDRVLVAVR